MTSVTDELSLVRAAIEAAYDEGCPVARDATAMAPVALRRWYSFGRRGLNAADRNDRIRDLAKGLAQRFEPDIKLVGPVMRDYPLGLEPIRFALSAHSDGELACVGDLFWDGHPRAEGRAKLKVGLMLRLINAGVVSITTEFTGSSPSIQEYTCRAILFDQQNVRWGKRMNFQSIRQFRW